VWKEEQEEAFSKIKDILAQDTMLTYPQFNKPFVMYTNTSEKQIEGVIAQDKKMLKC